MFLTVVLTLFPKYQSTCVSLSGTYCCSEISCKLQRCCSNQQPGSSLHYSTTQAVASKNDIGSNTVLCIQIGLVSMRSVSDCIAFSSFSNKEIVFAVSKCSPPTPMSRCEMTVRWTVYVTCYLFSESIRKLLRWSSSSSAHISGMREGRDRKRGPHATLAFFILG